MKNIHNVPPASESADLSLIRLRIGPPILGAGEWSIGDRTAETRFAMDTEGCGTVAAMGSFVDVELGLSFMGSAAPSCFDRWRWCIMAWRRSLSF